MGKGGFLIVLLASFFFLMSAFTSLEAQTTPRSPAGGNYVPEPSPPTMPLDPRDLHLPTLGPNGFKLTETRQEVEASLQILIILTLLTLTPALLLLMTPFTRIMIVLATGAAVADHDGPLAGVDLLHHATHH